MQTKSLFYSLSLAALSFAIFIANRRGNSQKEAELTTELENRLINKVKPTIDESELSFIGSWFERNDKQPNAFHFGLDYENKDKQTLIHEFFADNTGQITSHQVITH
ncbi:hypothetical protein [Lentilactobacillus sp. Marseille-Q4993]|uniref:hypothetical protein n=1 Tax=Lentilactobacillus sp. Marseille-Q4993 TaxID=3039492 RepID=UPI0024BC4488|nr:hypothetical protein [Lentilactobacillus sp. Marseille-Q4993]